VKVSNQRSLFWGELKKREECEGIFTLLCDFHSSVSFEFEGSCYHRNSEDSLSGRC
jgi:hypothetical protein